MKMNEDGIISELDEITHLAEVRVYSQYAMIKRACDFLLSLVGLIILLPIFILIALAIKLDDPKGGVFFQQERVGKDESHFKMYKFRSMYSNAEERLQELLKHNEAQGAMFKMKNDPRVTKVGAFIRKHSLDELPQLYNVLIGDMSLVGPRPPLVREVAEYTTYHKQRLSVTPGITGLWQISGRSALSFEEMVELDLQYIEERSILYDFKLILKTVIVVFKPNEAY